MSELAKMQSIIAEIENLSLPEKLFIYRHLQMIVRRNQTQLCKFVEEANDIDKIKRLLFSKKENAIEEMVTLLPCMNAENIEIKNVYLKIIPVLLSYVSLYDMKVKEALKIVDMLRVHPAFEDFQCIFQQWFELFNRRRMNTRRKFSYKDESYVRDLVELSPAAYSFNSEYARSVGYGNVSLLRCFHRWLRLHRLHKYLYFFSMLSYEQIFLLNSNTLEEYIDKIELLKITDGAKNKIIREVENLRQRKYQLEEILKNVLVTAEHIDSAIRELKRILRTPIPMKSDDKLKENIPDLLVAVIKKIFDSVMANLNLNIETMPIYGLFISVLKEAWNYNIFTQKNKDLFNSWRQTLSDNLSLNFQNAEVAERNYNVPVMTPIQYPISPESFTFQSSYPPDVTFGNSFYQCLEDISRNTAEYALK